MCERFKDLICESTDLIVSDDLQPMRAKKMVRGDTGEEMPEENTKNTQA